MAPLLMRYFGRGQRSLLSSLFTATFLGALVVVAFPCPVRSGDRSNAEARLESPGRENVVVMMNERGRRRFLEER
jgi:hypothetical protein